MKRQTKICIEEIFISQSTEERQKNINRLSLQIIQKFESYKVA
jgi:hypothetical protein